MERIQNSNSQQPPVVARPPQQPPTRPWYDPLLAVVQTVVRRLQTCEWVTQRRSRFQADLVGVRNNKEWTSYTGAAAQLISAGYQVSEVSIQAYMGDRQIQGREYQLCDTFMHSGTSHQLAQHDKPSEFVQNQLNAWKQRNEEQKGLQFFPVVLETNFGISESRHIVWVTVDHESKQIEYYDPKGLPMEGTAAQIVYEEVKKSLVGYSLKQNANRVQYDAHNCGVFGLAYAEARIRGMSFYRTVQLPLNIERVRDEMAQTMKVWAGRTAESEESSSLPIEDEDGFVEL